MLLENPSFRGKRCNIIDITLLLFVRVMIIILTISFGLAFLSVLLINKAFGLIKDIFHF